MKNKIGQIAFWEYDLFPFVLGGTITKVKDGLVETKEYGVGFYFEPTKILDFKRGTEILCKLQDLKNDRVFVLEIVEEGFKAKLGKVMEQLE